MKPYLLTTLGLLVVTHAGIAAAGDTTTDGFPACYEPHWLEAAVAHDERDDPRYERYIDTGKCIETREDMDISVINRYGDADSRRVEFEFKGLRFYTVAEAVASSL